MNFDVNLESATVGSSGSAAIAAPTASAPSASAAPSVSQVRRAPLNPNHWYAVALSTEVTQQPKGVVLWNEPIVLYRDTQQRVQALEDRCPHRQVRLSHGEVHGDQIECVYHGWQFDTEGKCVDIPYLNEKQRLPNCRLRTYPVLEQDGFIWVYPGDLALLQSQNIQPLALPEWDHLNYIAAVASIDVQAHFSFLIENLMDMYHGRLHDNLQAWANPKLRNIDATETCVDAHYDAETYYKIDRIWSVAQLAIPSMRKLRPTNLDVSYPYPNWSAVLGDDFRICCLFCPVSETQTKAYLLHFTSLKAFPRLHKKSLRFRRFIKRITFNSAKRLLDGLVRQDVLMMEDEQKAFEENARRKGPEYNPVIGKVQQLIVRQANDMD